MAKQFPLRGFVFDFLPIFFRHCKFGRNEPKSQYIPNHQPPAHKQLQDTGQIFQLTLIAAHVIIHDEDEHECEYDDDNNDDTHTSTTNDGKHNNKNKQQLLEFGKDERNLFMLFSPITNASYDCSYRQFLELGGRATVGHRSTRQFDHKGTHELMIMIAECIS